MRIDTIEQVLRDCCQITVEGEGYEVAYRVAADNLRLGQSVVADSCNPIELTRSEWARVAVTAGARWVDIEIVCSDLQEHRRRVETRTTSVVGLVPPTWKDVVNREYDDWTTERVVIDTAGKAVEESLRELVGAVVPK